MQKAPEVARLILTNFNQQAYEICRIFAYKRSRLDLTKYRLPVLKEFHITDEILNFIIYEETEKKNSSSWHFAIRHHIFYFRI